MLHYRFELAKDNSRAAAADPTQSGQADKPVAEALGQMRVSKQFWESVDEGNWVTALYSTKDPEINMLDAAGVYAAVSASRAVRA